jgi:F420-dependent oxidoreductase-like protein
MAPFFGFHMPNYTFPGTPDAELFERTVGLAATAERVGFDMITVMDHFYQIRQVGREDEPMLEAYTTLGALAMRTQRVLLGTLVTGVTYRNPAMLAKQVTTLDVISKGRAVLGIGAAWNESEHAAYGFEFPPIARREDRLDEALEICKAMFTRERSSFEGTFYRTDDAMNYPRPIHPGGPRILVGGAGEKRTLRAAARYADITNWFGSLEEAAPKIPILLAHCEAVGRDPSSILRTVSVPILLAESEADKAAVLASLPEMLRVGVRPVTIPEAADLFGAYGRAGFGGFVFRNATSRTPELVERAGELIALMRGA